MLERVNMLHHRNYKRIMIRERERDGGDELKEG